MEGGRTAAKEAIRAAALLTARKPTKDDVTNNRTVCELVEDDGFNLSTVKPRPDLEGKIDYLYYERTGSTACRAGTDRSALRGISFGLCITRSRRKRRHRKSAADFEANFKVHHTSYYHNLIASSLFD